MQCLESTYEEKNGSYKFNNVIVTKHSLLFLTVTDIDIPKILQFPWYCPDKFYSKQVNLYLEVDIKQFKSLEKLEAFKKTLNISRDIQTAVISENIWYQNIGHALFDGIYPQYLSMIKFGLIQDDYVQICHGWSDKGAKATEFLEKFSGNDILDLNTMDNPVLLCDTLIAGCGDKETLAGNRVVNKEYMVYGQKEYNAMTLFKNRCFSRFGLEINKPINKKPKVIIIDNKRYSDQDKIILNQLIKNYQNKIDIKYIHWGSYSSFYDQMLEYQDVDIQISGPGTGMNYLPFMKKGAVNINLGYMQGTKSGFKKEFYAIPNQNTDFQFPSWMEQPLAAAADYTSSLYYDRYNHNELKLNVLSDILDKAIETLHNPTENNWNTDALIFKEYCQKSNDADHACYHMTNLHSTFIESFINEHPSDITTRTNLHLLRKIKEKYSYGNKYCISSKLKKILVIPPTFAYGNTGDLSIIKTCQHILSGNQRQSDILKQNTNLDEYQSCIMFGNDILAYYEGFWAKSYIRSFLNSNRNVYVLNTSWGRDAKDTLTEYKDFKNLYMYFRDVNSLEMINEQFVFINAPKLCSDISHLCPSDEEIDDENLKTWIFSRHKKIIGINVHKDFKRHNQKVWDNYVKLIQDYNSEFSFLFIPHDSRPHVKEKDILSKLIDQSKPKDYFLSNYLDPFQEKLITKYLYILITGRMHLAVLTIPHLIPSIGIEYNGIKTFGTFKHWGIEDLALKADDIDNIHSSFAKILHNYSLYRSILSTNKHKVEKLAMSPFDDIF